jgi:hypothetical protein
MTERQPKTPAQRQREARQRRRNGDAVFRVVVPKQLVQEALLDAGEVPEWSDEDQIELERALTRILLRTLRDVTA